MKRFLIIALAGLVLSGGYDANAAMTGSSYYNSPQKLTRSERKAERAYRKEQRKAKRAEYRARLREKNGRGDYDMMMRENNRQRRKMEKASRKENNRRWDTNELGDVFRIN